MRSKKTRTLFVVFLLGILSITVAVCNSKVQSSFSTEHWSANESMRYKMIESLEAKYDLIGMSEDEILDLLGRPNITYPPTTPHLNPQSQYLFYKYYIGPPEPPFSIMFEPYIYQIVFQAGKVISTSVQPT